MLLAEQAATVVMILTIMVVMAKMVERRISVSKVNGIGDHIS